MSNSNQSNQFNVSRETIRPPSSYKVQAVKDVLNLRVHMFGTALALLVKFNWDVVQAQAQAQRSAQYDTTPASVSVTYLPIVDLNMKLYFAPSVNHSNGIGTHMLIVKNEEPTYVLFIGFHEFSIISQIVAGLGQMKLVRGMKGIDECREVKTRQWVMSNVDKLSHRIVTCLFGSDLGGLYTLL